MPHFRAKRRLGERNPTVAGGTWKANVPGASCSYTNSGGTHTSGSQLFQNKMWKLDWMIAKVPLTTLAVPGLEVSSIKL